ncbi:MAG: class I SAM-dependent methyltransferase [Gemmatimonadota bacterium]
MREQDIRDREAHSRYLEMVRKDAEALAVERSRFILIDCPACGGCQHEFAFEKVGFTYATCADCETLFVNPRPAYELLAPLYTDSEAAQFWIHEFFAPKAQVRREKIFRPRAADVAARFPQLGRGARVGDIGAGFGLFLQELRRQWPAAELVAIEPSDEMADMCREKGLVVVNAMLEDMKEEQGGFLLLTAFEIFEHIYDPASFLRRVRELLAPGGRLYLTTLNGQGFDIQVFWARSKAVFPPHHLNFANPRSVRILLERCGFEVDEVSTPGVLDWDIVESAFVHEDSNPGRFFCTVAAHATQEAKRALQEWVRTFGFSSHMRVIAHREET